MFNSLSYATQLVNAGVPREQAEVHAQVLQGVYEQEHEQYATKADFIVMRNEVTTQIEQLETKTDRLEAKADRLEVKTDRLEAKTDRLEAKTDRLEAKTDRIDKKVSEFEIKITADIADLKTTINECKKEFSNFQSDILVLKSSNKYILWIGGAMVTMFVSMFGINVSMLLTR